MYYYTYGTVQPHIRLFSASKGQGGWGRDLWGVREREYRGKRRRRRKMDWKPSFLLRFCLTLCGFLVQSGRQNPCHIDGGWGIINC